MQHSCPAWIPATFGESAVTMLMDPALVQFWVETDVYVIEKPEDKITFSEVGTNYVIWIITCINITQ